MDFHFIKKLPKEQQLEMYMTLLVEIGGSIQVRRNQFSLYWIPAIKEQLDNENLQIDYTKQQIRELL